MLSHELDFLNLVPYYNIYHEWSEIIKCQSQRCEDADIVFLTLHATFISMKYEFFSVSENLKSFPVAGCQ